MKTTFVDYLFVMLKCSLDKIFSMYSDNIQVVSTRNLRSVISDMCFG